MKRKQKFLWVTDPWHTLDHPRDTSLRLVEEALILGIDNYWCDVRTIRLQSSVELDARRVLDIASGRRAFSLEHPQVMHPLDFTRIIYRTDPPVDLTYLHPLQLLNLGVGKHRGTEIVNDTDTLFGSSEKLESSYLPHSLMPKTLVSSDTARLEDFGKRLGRAVLKPIHQAQSKGVELLDFRNSRAVTYSRNLLTDATHQGTHLVLLQEFLPGIARGETRLWFLNGKLFAACRKHPERGDFRVNIDHGSELGTVKLGHKDLAAARAISKRLRETRVRLAAIDLIDGKVTDFNVTSPGLIVQMEEILKRNLAGPIVKSLARPWR